MTEGYRGELTHDLDNLQLELMKMSESYHDRLKHYSDTLEASINDAESFMSQNDLVKLHQNTKLETQTQVRV